MPNIPTVTPQVSARSARSDGRINARVTPEAMGAGVGRAVQQLGGAIGNAADARKAETERKRREDVANRVAQSDFTRHELDLRQNTGPNGAGYQEQALTEYDNFKFNEAQKITDDETRRLYLQQMDALRPSVSSRSATYEFGLNAQNSEVQANASLSALQNKLVLDPTQYDAFVQQGEAVIAERPGLTSSARAGMQLTWRQNAAKSRFDGMMEAAASLADIDNIAAELADTKAKDWAAELAPQDFARVVNDLGTAKKQMVTLADTNARAALDTLETRADDLALIPASELEATQSLVKQSQNPVTVSRMARIVRDQELKKQYGSLDSTEARAAANAVNGSPSIGYPGVPAPVSDAINVATGEFDVSASYLGATAVREYGGNFQSGRIQVDTKFTPAALHSGVDFRNVNPEVIDAATLAGELYGAPLQITSGSRTQEQQNAIRANGDPNRPGVARDSNHTHGTALDISTVGMSSADKGRLAASLADAGFTGFGEYGTHIHADMRAAVPASFGDRGGSVWGGWTNLSPDVAKALTDRGFAAGLSSQQLKRNPRTQNVTATDYGVQSATSSATGVMQITEPTFLGIVKDPGTAARMGVDTTGMSDAQLLDLRKDPRVSVLAAAALAEQNKKALTAALGRPVTDPELYMAHFMGAGGATTFLGARKNTPNASAASILPQAAEANKSVFYHNGKPLTVQQVYDNISRQFVSEPSRVGYGDAQTLGRIATQIDTQKKDDPMTLASSSGAFSVQPLNIEGGITSRGATARAVAEYYSIPLSEMKPFTVDEAANIKSQLDGGTADDVLGIMSQVQQMGGDVARAALAQIGQTDPTFAFAGSLALERGGQAVASDIIRGSKRLTQDPTVTTQIGIESTAIDQKFNAIAGAALAGVDPRQADAIRKSALAHYVETYTARGNVGFNDQAFAASVQAVMGGTKDAPAIGVVNGKLTVLPAGIDATTLKAAFGRMTMADWAKQSVSGTPPMYITGEPIQPYDLASEATLQAIGGDQYRVLMGDGTFAITGQVAQNGRVDAYIFAPRADELKKIVNTVVPGDAGVAPTAAPTSTTQGGPWQQSWDNMQGQSQFDENGRWLGPKQ